MTELSAITSYQFERGYLPQQIKYGTSVQVPIYDEHNQLEATRTIELARTQFACGNMAWVGYDKALDRWFWRKA